MTEQLAEAYTRVGNDNDALVIPAGLAFTRVVARRPHINLYLPDERHPSLAGTYLAAATTYAALFKRSPVGLGYTAGRTRRSRASCRRWPGRPCKITSGPERPIGRAAARRSRPATKRASTSGSKRASGRLARPSARPTTACCGMPPSSTRSASGWRRTRTRHCRAVRPTTCSASWCAGTGRSTARRRTPARRRGRKRCGPGSSSSRGDRQFRHAQRPSSGASSRRRQAASVLHPWRPRTGATMRCRSGRAVTSA